MTEPGADAVIVTPPFTPQWWGNGGAALQTGGQTWCSSCAATHEGSDASERTSGADPSFAPLLDDPRGWTGGRTGPTERDAASDPDRSDEDCAVGPGDGAYAHEHPGYLPPSPSAGATPSNPLPAPGGPAVRPLTPPPWGAIAPKTRDCFSRYYTTVWHSPAPGPIGTPPVLGQPPWPWPEPLTDYPPFDCEEIPIAEVSTCLYPGPADLEPITVAMKRAPEEVWPPYGEGCQPDWFDPSRNRVRHTMHELCRVAMWVLRQNTDVIEWACCLMTHWSPQWNARPPYAYEAVVPPEGPVADGLSSDLQFQEDTGQPGGNPNLGRDIVVHVEEGHLNLALISLYRFPPEGDTFTNQANCTNTGPGAGVVHFHEAREIGLRYPSAVVIAVDNERWEAYRDLFANATDDLVKLCVAVRAASSLLHEFVHLYGFPWATHLDNGCLDPANMVQTAFLWAMGRRWPCLANVPCCADAINVDVFMGKGAGYGRC